MDAALAGIPEADWRATPASIRTLILALQQENHQLRNQLTVLAIELAQPRKRIGRSSRNASKPPSRDGPGTKPPERRKGSGRQRGGLPGHSWGALACLPRDLDCCDAALNLDRDSGRTRIRREPRRGQHACPADF